jgi:triacylglycerol lipase
MSKLLPNPEENRLEIHEFNPDNYKEFDTSMAHILAELIQQAYNQFDDRVCGTRKFQDFILQSENIIVPLIEDRRKPFGFVTFNQNSNNVFIVFRGTRALIEGFEDANLKLVFYEEVTGVNGSDYVTAGFRDIYANLRQQILNVLNNLPQNSQIFVTGHSLGGALATLAVPDILHNTKFKDPKKIVLYTFASPRCGDREFATKFKETQVQHWRIANTEDFVTLLPFPTGNVFKAAAPNQLEE